MAAGIGPLKENVISEDIDELPTGSDEAIALEDGEEESQDFQGIAHLIKDRFHRSETDRWKEERRWTQAYRNYRGEYGPDMVFRNDEKSRVFVKITKTKVLAAYGQIIEVLFSKGKFPITIEPTVVPEGISEFAHTDVDPKGEIAEQVRDLGFPGDGQELLPGATSLTGELKLEGQLPFVEGPAPESNSFIQIQPAAKAAKKLEKVIHDQLDASGGTTVLRHAAFECALLGTGIIKGPFNIEKTVNWWKKDEESGDRTYSPYTKTVPKIESVSIFDFYPDPEANVIEDAEWVIQRHKMSRSDLRHLIKRPFFRSDSIRNCLDTGPNYFEKSFESRIETDNTSGTSERFEVLEYWGIIDAKTVMEAGIDADDLQDLDPLEEVQVNVWICGDEILRLVMNPFTPDRIPYNVVPYEMNPYSMFGIGVAENMEDSQMIMNGHVRMAIDNLALAGNMVFDIDETMLVAGQDMRIYPGKIFRRQGGVAGQAVFALKFPSTAGENLEMFRVFRQFADEETGIPSFSHGQTGVQGTGRTAAGISMLMGAAALSIKTVIRNIDHFLLKPLGEAFFNWNMQFNDDDDIEFRGDLEIKANGTSALMQKEVKSQRLLMFLQVASNPALAPLVKWPFFLEEIAESLEIDPDKILNSPTEAMMYAKLIGMTNAQSTSDGAQPSNQQQGGVGGTGQVPPGANPTNTTGVGDGTIGTGVAPSPGEAGFSSPNQ